MKKTKGGAFYETLCIFHSVR